MTRKIGLAAICLILSTSALAQGTLLGAGLRSRPDYDGSSKQVTDVVPVIRYYGERWFARTTQGILEGGMRAALDKDLWAGAQLAYEAEFDHPTVDAPVGGSAGLHLEWDRYFGRVPATFLLRARQHLDTSLGGQADLRVRPACFHAGGCSPWRLGRRHGVRRMPWLRATEPATLGCSSPPSACSAPTTSAAAGSW